MRDRDRANKNEIEIFVFSVTSNNFPHDMRLLTFSSNLGSKTMVPQAVIASALFSAWSCR
jgi:hypothetical protein